MFLCHYVILAHWLLLWNLGLIFDCELRCDKQINQVVKLSFM